MKGNKYFLKVAVVGIIFLLLGISFLPTTIGNSNSNENYNLTVYIKPLRHVFPRIYAGNSQPIGFLAGAMNKGPGSSPAFTLKFEIIKILGTESYEYNETYDVHSLQNGSGLGTTFTWRTLIGFHFGMYAARAIINVNDNNLEDNIISYYFITLNR